MFHPWKEQVAFSDGVTVFFNTHFPPPQLKHGPLAFYAWSLSMHFTYLLQSQLNPSFFNTSPNISLRWPTHLTKRALTHHHAVDISSKILNDLEFGEDIPQLETFQREQDELNILAQTRSEQSTFNTLFYDVVKKPNFLQALDNENAKRDLLPVDIYNSKFNYNFPAEGTSVTSLLGLSRLVASLISRSLTLHGKKHSVAPNLYSAR